MTQLFYVGEGAPSTAPEKAQRFYLDTLNDNIYISKGTSSSADWIWTNGVNGTDGVGIDSITRTSGTGAAGTTDTYTITYSDANTSTFTVVNGSNGTNGTNGDDGIGIVSVIRTSGDGSAGSTDTYTITYSDTSTSTFTVVNGTNGTSGTGGDTLVTEGALIASATDKSTPVDADYLGLMDSAASNILKKLSWANVKATLKTYFDSLYSSLGGCTVNSQSSAYTLVLADAGKIILHPSADTTARIWTIPANSSVAYPIGTLITFTNQNGAGVITLSITTDTMRLAGAGTTGSRTLAANGTATAQKLTATEWLISGNGLT